MATINELNINGTLYDINDKRIPGIDTIVTSNSSNLITSGAVSTALTLYTPKEISNADQGYNIKGVSFHKYEGQDATTYKLPTPYCILSSMIYSKNRGFALAGEGRGDYYQLYANHLHDDSSAGYGGAGGYPINSNIYSEDEMGIGRGIDGRQMYRKVIKRTGTQGQSQSFSLGISNVYEYLGIDVKLACPKTFTNNSASSVYYQSGSDYFNGYMSTPSSGNLTIRGGSDGPKSTTLYVIVTYTK